MTQMYKVFIDNWPVFITYEHENLTSVEIYTTIVYKEQIDWETLDKVHHEAKMRNQYLQVIISQEITCIADCFVDFKFIEAAGGIVRNDQGDILVINRLGCWDLPKGKIDSGEDRYSAALREVEEECGIHGHLIIAEITTTYHTYVMKGRLILKATYWYLMEYAGSEELIPQIEENITEVKWWPIQSIDQIKHTTYLSIIEVLEEYQKRLI
jgi:8-oxo-dGTP pyrophosphatase MutT (NUDIX family)